MVKFQNRFLIAFFLLLVPMLVFCQDDPFIGLWRSKNSTKENTDSYIAIEKFDNNQYLVLHVDYFNNHQLDYFEYGNLNKDGYIVIKTEDAVFYLELNEKGYLYHNWNFIYDFNADRFEKMADKETMEKRSRVPEISLEDFYKFIKSQEENQDE